MIHPCVACGANWNEAMCVEPKQCPECDHQHNFVGCRNCPCHRCPGCGHVHTDHEPLEGQETGFEN